MVKPIFAEERQRNGEWLWSDKELEITVSMMNAGKSEEEVADAIGRGEDPLRRKLSKIGYYKEVGRGRNRLKNGEIKQSQICEQLNSIKKAVDAISDLIENSDEDLE